MKRDLFHTQLRLAGFNLDSYLCCPCATAADWSFEQLVKLLDAICSRTSIVPVYSKPVPRCYQVSLCILQTIAMLVPQAPSKRTIFVVVDVVVECFKIWGLLHRRAWLCNYKKTIPVVQTIWSVKCCELHALLADWNATICVSSIQLQKVLAVRKLLPLAYSQIRGSCSRPALFTC